MGTTLLIATLTEPHDSKPDTHEAIMHYAHVGDSRLYRVRRGELSLLTRDHTVAQWWVDNGLCSANEARASSGAHRLTRAIGMDDDLVVEIGHCISTPGDLFLLCSDGLTHELDDEQIAAYCRRAWQAGDSADSLCRQLVELANEAGGRDNISVLVVHHCDTAKYT
jgi:protein phosphatase